MKPCRNPTAKQEFFYLHTCRVGTATKNHTAPFVFVWASVGAGSFPASFPCWYHSISDLIASAMSGFIDASPSLPASFSCSYRLLYHCCLSGLVSSLGLGSGRAI